MERTLNFPGSTPVRVLIVGSSPWLREAATTIEANDVSVDDVSTIADVDRHDTQADCLLTDERELLGAAEYAPVVFVETEDDRGEIEVTRALSNGAIDVLTRNDFERPALVRHRLRRAARSSDVQQALDDREVWYRALIEQSSTLLLVLDENRRQTYVSPSVERVAGYTPDELLGDSIDDHLHPDDRDTVLETFDDVRDGGSGATRSCVYGCRHADGSWCVHEAVFTNRLDDPTVQGVIVSIQDVTEYQRVERQLDRSLEYGTDAFLELDTERRITHVNDRATDILDQNADSLLGRSVLETFPEAEGTSFERVLLEAMENQEPQTIESYYEPLGIWIESRLFPSESGLSIYFRDVSERIDREQELVKRTERLQTLLENVPVVLFVLDSEGRFTVSEGSGLEQIGLEPGEVTGESVMDVYADHPGILDDVTRALNGESVHNHRELANRIFETWYQPITRNGTLERVIGFGIDITERMQYEQSLNALHEATRHLLNVESRQAACEYIVDVADSVLDLSGVVVYRFNERENELAPVAYSTNLVTKLGRPQRYQPNESIAWHSFVMGEPEIHDDVRDSEHISDPSTDVRSGLFVPLGEHGILVAVSTETGLYDEETFELAQLFGATAETALDRISQTKRLHDREHELERKNEHLEQLNHASQLRESVEQLLLRAESRTEIEQGVCDRLIEGDDCTFAWIGEPDPGGNHIFPRVEAGLVRGYLDAVTVTTVDNTAAEPTGRTALTRRPGYIENIAESLRDGAWRAEALSRNFQSMYAVPIVYDDFLYGVLSVYANRRGGFDEPTRSTLSELGETIGYAIDAVQRKNALLGEEVTELELEIDDQSPLSQLSTRLDSRIELEGVIPQSDESTIVFVTIEGDRDDEIDEQDGIDEMTVIGRTDGQTVVQLGLTEPFLSSIVDTHGGSLREFVADRGRTRVTIDIPRSVDVREILSALNRRGVSAAMLARREQTPGYTGGLRGPYRNPMLEEFTERQREVVQAAYHSGFFEWPRRTTGEEVAMSLDISSPAFHNHIRSAERKLFSALFDHEATS